MPAATTPSLTLSGGAWADGDCVDSSAGNAEVQQALEQLAAVKALVAAGSCHRLVLCEAYTEAARALASVRALSMAETCLAQALRCASRLGALDLQADLQCGLAELVAHGARQLDLRDDPGAPEARRRARRHAQAAARLAGRTSDPQWELKLLLRASEVLAQCGSACEAVLLQQRALLLMGVHPADPAAPQAPAGTPPVDALQLAAPAALM